MPKAFPEAYGFGANAVGGRGGDLYVVTNLNDSGSGSYRDAVSQSNRIIVFRVGGTISLLSDLIISASYLTIAGQTAPGGGILLRSDDHILYQTSSCHNIITRYLRFRQNADVAVGRDNGGANNDAHDLIFDHCSYSWGTDGNGDISVRAYNVTYQWCIFAEGITDSTGRGMQCTDGARRVSLYHCLFAHNFQRSPKLKGEAAFLGGNPAYFDFVNNVIYNWGNDPVSIAGEGKGHVVANYIKNGGDSQYPTPREIVTQQHQDGRLLYAVQNIGPSNDDPDADNWLAGMISDISGTLKDHTSESYSATPIFASDLPVESASAAYDSVLADAGANKRLASDGSWVANQDSVDQRILKDVADGTGSLPTSVAGVGGFPTIAAGTAYGDSDSDGMADEWENSQGLDPNDASDGPLVRESGYTNIENFLNGAQEEENGEGGGGSVPSSVAILGASSTPMSSLDENTEIDEFWESYFRDIERAQRS